MELDGEKRRSLNISPTHTPDWQALRLINQYRLLLLLAMAAIYYLSEDQRTLGSLNSNLFETVHLAYVVFTLGFVLLVRFQTPNINTHFYLQSYLDILLICGLMYASGGVRSGLGPILLINLALLSQLCAMRHAMLFAAIASMVITGEELLINMQLGKEAANYEAAALLGSLMFATAWIMTVLLRRLLERQLVTPSRSRSTLNVEQVAQLNEEIIRELDSGVLVVDNVGNVQLINDTARTLLAVEFQELPIHLRRLCKDLNRNMNVSERSPTRETRPFQIEGTGQSVLPQYTRLSQGGMLIKLDDHAQIRQQFQQLKLASLGRMSASIAHEIRNPLGAISHAVQLIQESPSLDEKDADLLQIAKRHTVRINRIIEDVLQLSNRQQVSTELVSVDELLTGFAKRFTDENDLRADFLNITINPCSALVDPGHLDQILWNLCINARLHNEQDNLQIDISCYSSGLGTTIIDVVDNGKGVSDMDRENLFEPFYSTHHEGTGLGLFIIHELCNLNKAQIDCLAKKHGAHFRVTLANVQDMAA